MANLLTLFSQNSSLPSNLCSEVERIHGIEKLDAVVYNRGKYWEAHIHKLLFRIIISFSAEPEINSK
jgi:hypothetical protein